MQRKNKILILAVLVLIVGVSSGYVLWEKSQTKQYRNGKYGFEINYPKRMAIDTDSKVLFENLDEFNLFKINIGGVLVTVLKRKNRPDAVCSREGDLKIFTDCLIQGERYGNKASYEKKLGDNTFIFKEYEITDSPGLRPRFINAYLSSPDYIYAFESGNGPEKKEILEEILSGFKLIK